MLQHALVVGLLTVLASCEGATTTVCTQAGCANGVLIQLASDPGAPYRIELRTSSTGPRYVIDCASATACRYSCPTAAAGCTAEAFFAEYTPSRVWVRVTVAGVTREQEVTPQYLEFWPNGRDCPPPCRVGRVTVAIPA